MPGCRSTILHSEHALFFLYLLKVDILGIELLIRCVTLKIDIVTTQMISGDGRYLISCPCPHNLLLFSMVDSS